MEDKIDLKFWKSGIKVCLLTSWALIAFAANSVLCRVALGTEAIDAAGFTAIRLVSGSVALFFIIMLRSSSLTLPTTGSWFAGCMLFLYAITFSYAYIELETGTGALILFGAVQLTMICMSLIQGNRLVAAEWFGLGLAFSGLVYLVLPGVSAPSLNGFILMTSAGIAWGFYTLIGRGSENPLGDTACNFLRTSPLVAILILFTFRDFSLSLHGVILAIASGSVTSGLGYAVWYLALRDLSATQAAVAQLFVPVIAAFGGVFFMAESISLRLVVSAAMILGGIFFVTAGRLLLRKQRASKL